MFIGLLFYGVFFFVKQKTAYEMRISDWSSDVCSSDLFARHRTPRENVPPRPDPAEWPAHQPPRRQDVRLHAVEQARKAHPAFVAHQRDAVAASGQPGREGGGGNHMAAGAAASAAEMAFACTAPLHRTLSGDRVKNRSRRATDTLNTPPPP